MLAEIRKKTWLHFEELGSILRNEQQPLPVTARTSQLLHCLSKTQRKIRLHPNIFRTGTIIISILWMEKLRPVEFMKG